MVTVDLPSRLMTVGALRIAIAEDSAILRDGLVQLLVDRGFAITGAVGEPAALRSSVAQNPPDVAVIDIRMPPTFTDEGLRLALELRAATREWASSSSPSTSRPATPLTSWPTTPPASATC